MRVPGGEPVLSVRPLGGEVSREGDGEVGRDEREGRRAVPAKETTGSETRLALPRGRTHLSTLSPSRPAPSRLNTCTVPLSLHTPNLRPSRRQPTPQMTALSDPLLSSRTSAPVRPSQIRMSVPRSEDVERTMPDGGQESEERAVVWVMMIVDLAWDCEGGVG